MALHEPKQIKLACKKHQNRRLTATTSGHVTTAPHNPESDYQMWEKVGEDSSFTLENKATGKYLAYSHNAMRLERDPYRWGYDAKRPHMYPKEDNSRVVAVAPDDPRHVLLKEYLPHNETDRSQRNEQQRLLYLDAVNGNHERQGCGLRALVGSIKRFVHPTALHEVQPKRVELMCSKHPDRRLSATASGLVTTDPHKPGSTYQMWEKVGEDSSFTLKNKATATYLAYSHNAIRLEKDPFYWAYDEEMWQIYPKDDNYRALAVGREDPLHLVVQEYETDNETQKWETTRLNA